MQNTCEATHFRHWVVLELLIPVVHDAALPSGVWRLIGSHCYMEQPLGWQHCLPLGILLWHDHGPDIMLFEEEASTMIIHSLVVHYALEHRHGTS